MELNSQVAHYVVRFHGHLMTEVERKAQRHLFATMKATKGDSDEPAQREAQTSKTLFPNALRRTESVAPSC